MRGAKANFSGAPLLAQGGQEEIISVHGAGEDEMLEVGAYGTEGHFFAVDAPGSPHVGHGIYEGPALQGARAGLDYFCKVMALVCVIGKEFSLCILGNVLPIYGVRGRGRACTYPFLPDPQGGRGDSPRYVIA